MQIECPCRSEKRNRYVLQGNGLSDRRRLGTRCPVSDILSTFFNCVSSHRPTHNSMRSRRSNRSVSCTAFSTIVMFCTLGLTLGPRLRCGIRACQIQSVFLHIDKFEGDEPPSRARKGSECHPRNRSVLLSNSHDSQGWKRTCGLDRKVKARRKVDAANS